MTFAPARMARAGIAHDEASGLARESSAISAAVIREYRRDPPPRSLYGIDPP